MSLTEFMTFKPLSSVKESDVLLTTSYSSFDNLISYFKNHRKSLSDQTNNQIILDILSFLKKEEMFCNHLIVIDKVKVFFARYSEQEDDLVNVIDVDKSKINDDVECVIL